MFIEPDCVLRPADQSGQPPLALDQRQVAKVRTVMLDQVEGEQHRLMAPAFAPQRAEVRCPILNSAKSKKMDRDTTASVLRSALRHVGRSAPHKAGRFFRPA
jgi:hypothetical protein